jgi:hypothetical protein
MQEIEYEVLKGTGRLTIRQPEVQGFVEREKIL